MGLEPGECMRVPDPVLQRRLKLAAGAELAYAAQLAMLDDHCRLWVFTAPRPLAHNRGTET